MWSWDRLVGLGVSTAKVVVTLVGWRFVLVGCLPGVEFPRFTRGGLVNPFLGHGLGTYLITQALMAVFALLVLGIEFG